MTKTKFRNLCLAFLLLGTTACSEPFLYFSGGRLSGDEVTLIDLPSASGVLQIETLPSDPYSVNIGFVLLDGKLYIDPALDRQWYQNILVDPAVRVRFSDSKLVHPMMTVREPDPKFIAQLDATRIVLRLEPR